MLASTMLPLALAGVAASIVPSASASPVQLAGRAPTLSGSDGTVSRDLLQRDFTQAVERSVAHLSARTTKKDEDCKVPRRSRKAKRSSTSVPLSNEGDAAYLASISIGTPAQELSVMIDTGSGDLVVPKVTAGSPAPKGAFDSKKSRTFIKGDGSKTVFTYAVGAAVGEVVQDKVRIGNYVKIKQPFGLADEMKSPPFGILGLAFSSISKIDGPTFLDRLVQDKNLDKNLFGLYHSRGSAPGSQLTLGAIDASRYTGELTATPVVSHTHWTVQLNHATIDGQSIYDGPVFSAVDSGSSTTVIPKAIADDYFARVPGSSADPNLNITTTISGKTVVGQIYEYPCDAHLPALGFVFEGSDRVFEIAAEDMFIPQPPYSADKPKDETCFSSIVGADVIYYGQKAALIGVPFLKSFYSVFNLDDSTVSFATARH
ncbi:hypothetical protein JCM11491_003709 [Sporobolomyces phaffii]